MYKVAKGEIFIIKPIWWLRLNTKGMSFGESEKSKYPHIVKAKYTVDDKEYECKKWVSIYESVPKMGQSVLIYYDENDPLKSHMKL